MKKFISLAAAGLISAMALAQDTIPATPRTSMPGKMDTMPKNRNLDKKDTSLNRNNKWQDTTAKKNRNMPDTMNNSVMNNGKDSSMANTTAWPSDTSAMINNTGMENLNKKSTDSGMNNHGAVSGNTQNRMDTTKAMTKPMDTRANMESSTREKGEDRVFMKDGQMMLIKNGDSTLMDENVTLSSGGVVMKDGLVKYQNGKTVQLKNGQYINLVTEEKVSKSTKTVSKKTKKTITPGKKSTGN